MSILMSDTSGKFIFTNKHFILATKSILNSFLRFYTFGEPHNGLISRLEFVTTIPSGNAPLPGGWHLL